jgi:hypothetical protein
MTYPLIFETKDAKLRKNKYAVETFNHSLSGKHAKKSTEFLVIAVEFLPFVPYRKYRGKRANLRIYFYICIFNNNLFKIYLYYHFATIPKIILYYYFLLIDEKFSIENVFDIKEGRLMTTATFLTCITFIDSNCAIFLMN